MARSRNIKPGFFLNEELSELSFETRLLFIGLWTIADKEGRLEDRPKRIHISCLPYDQVNVDSMLTDLETSGFIVRYSVDGKKYIQIINWLKHQAPHHKEADSEIPEYDINHKDIHAQAKHDSSIPQAQVNEIASCPTDSLIPDSGFSDSLNPIPDSVTSESKDSSVPFFPQAVASDKPDPKKEEEPLTKKTWMAYSQAYEKRYGVAPIRNRTVAGQLANFVKRIGREESPHVAAFFVNHNNQFYVTKMHTVGLLLADSEKLRTEWATNRTMTQTQARQADKTQARGNVFNKLIDEVTANESN